MYLRLDFESTIAIFAINALGLALLQSFVKKAKPKLPYFGIFELEFKETFIVFETSSLKFV